MNKLLKNIILAFILLSTVVVIGIFMKITHWPYANIVLISGLTGEMLLGLGSMIYLLFNKKQ